MSSKGETRILVLLGISSMLARDLIVLRHYFKIVVNYTNKIDHVSHF